MSKRVLVGLSGGIDSSYVCKYLTEKGYDAVGVFLKLHEYADYTDAENVSKKLGIPFVVADYSERFNDIVKQNFIDEYSSGRTPNPCVICNRDVKFFALLNEADKYNCDYVATGHYVNVLHEKRNIIEVGNDTKKDQSYVLWRLTQQQLSRLIMPMGSFKKEYVKNEVFSSKILPATTGESQEICFIPDNDYIRYIENIKGNFPTGDFVDTDGKVIGHHSGIIRYTVGQRKRLGAFGRPAFVSKINLESNTITIGFGNEIFTRSMTVNTLNFVSCSPFEGEGEFTVKSRYKSNPSKANVIIKNGVASVEFEDPQRAVTPGQSAVFYKDRYLMFGGFIADN